MNNAMIVFGSVIINLIFLGVLIYFWLSHVPQNGEPRPSGEDSPGVRRQRYRIAILRTIQSRDFEQTTQGVVDTLHSEAKFIADVKVFDANNSRTLMYSCTDEILKGNYDLICVLASQGAQMVRELTARQEKPTPVVFVGTGDPVKLELVDSLERPGHNVTGVSVLGFDWAYQAGVFVPVLLPHVQRVLIPYNPSSFGGSIENCRELLVKSLEKRGVQVTSVQIYEPNEVTQKIVPFLSSIDLLIVLPDSTLLGCLSDLGRLGEQHQFGVYALMNYAKIYEGASLVFGYYTYDSGKKAAGLIRRILEDGESPSLMPVQGLDDMYRIAVNKQEALAQGVYEKMDPVALYLMEHGELT